MLFTATPCGFGMTFDNGICISVQWSDTNYCHARLKNPDDYERYPASTTAEIAIIPNEEYPNYFDFSLNGTPDYVRGWLTADEVATWISIVSKKPSWESLLEDRIGILRNMNLVYNSTDNKRNLRTEEINEQGDEEE
jgi:hypothetical protein